MIPIPPNLVQAILAIHLAMEMKELYGSLGEYLQKLYGIQKFSCFLFNNDTQCYSLDYSTVIPPLYWDEIVFEEQEAPFRVLFHQEPTPFPVQLQWFEKNYPMHWAKKLSYEIETAAAVVFHEFPEGLEEDFVVLGFLLHHFTTALIRTTIYCEMRNNREKQAARLDLINEMGNMVSNHNLEPLLAALMSMALKITGAEVGSIMLYNENQTLETMIEWGLKEDLLRGLTFRNDHEKSFAESVCAEREIFIVRDFNQEDRLEKPEASYQLNSIVSFPLLTNRKTYGLLNLVNLDLDNQNFNQDIETLKTIAHLAASSIENHSLRRQLENSPEN